MRPRTTVVVFDLDDTLYYEADFVRGGLTAACRVLTAHGLHYRPARAWQHVRAGRPALDALCAELPAAWPLRARMLAAYRAQCPQLTLRPGAAALLARCRAAGAGLALVSDGRERCQRHKLRALGLADAFEQVLISEAMGVDKRHPAACRRLTRTMPARRYMVVGDNCDKDFTQALRRGWRCVCIRDDGRHIHPQPARMPAGVTAVDHLDAALEDGAA